MQITKSREAPFKFWEKEKQRLAAKNAQQADQDHFESKKPAFKANPIPRACSVLIFAKKMK